MGFPMNWTKTEPTESKLTLGNAIVPQIAREFGLAIKKVLSDEDII